MKTVEVISIGDELLRGIVQDTNSFEIIKRVTARGASVTRVALLPDDPATVAEVMRESLGRAPRLIVTQGGLGPTEDDRTREAVCLALNVPAEQNREAGEIVARRYRELQAEGAVPDADVHEARARMARLPRGAIPLDNHVGTAPGVLVERDGTAIVCLPGVPPELLWIWDNTLAPHLDRVLGAGGFAEQTVVADLLDESKLSWLLSMVQDRHRHVYVKSRAKGFGAEDHIRLTISCGAESRDEAVRSVEHAMHDLRAALAAEGVRLRE